MSGSTFEWATVTALSPLRVQLDGDTAALAGVTPDSLTDPEALAVNDRVRVELAGNRVIVHGQSNESHYSRAAIAALVRGRKNPVLNGNFRTNQKAVVSGVSLAAQELGFDRWRCAGITNLDTNPRFEAAATGWTNFGGSTNSRSSTQAHSGTYSMALSATATADSGAAKTYSGLVAGEWYTVSAWVYLTNAAANSLGRGLYGRLGSQLPADSNMVYDHSKLNQWQRVSLFIIPAEAGTFEVRVYADPSAIVYIDDILVTRGRRVWPYFDGSSSDSAWSGSADASTSTRGPATTTLTFTAAPQGQPITISSGGRISHVFERADMPAATRVLSFVGTATARVYNVGTALSALPAFAASGSTWVIDGLDDVVLEFAAVGGTKTVSEVQLEIAAAPTAYELLTAGEELALCQQYFVQWKPQVAGQRLAASGAIVAGTQAEVWVIPPVTLRELPSIKFTALFVTDGIVANWAISALSHYIAAVSGVQPNMIGLITIHAGTSTAPRPAVISAQNGTTSLLRLDTGL